MIELSRDVVSGEMEAESPLIDRSASLWVELGETVVIDTGVNAIGVGVEMSADEFDIAEGGSHEDIGVAAALDEKARDLLAVTHHVLGRGGFVIDIAGVDIRAVGEEELGHFQGAGKMERSLAIAAASVDEARVGGDERLEPIDHPEACGSVNIDRGSALDRISREVSLGIVQ